MKRFILYRLLQFIPAILGVTFVTFGLMHMAPGDPIDTRLSSAGIAADPAMVQALRDSFGLNDSFWVQYGRWLGHFVQGDMGISYITDQSVSHLLGAALPYTIVMALVAMVITLAVSVPVGMYLANRQHSRIDTGVRWLTFLGNSIPNFIIAIFLLYVVAFQLEWVPVLPTRHFVGVILPAMTLAIVMSSRYIRQVRVATLEELSKSYIIGLRARGLSEWHVMMPNVLISISPTIVTLTALSIGSLMGGAVIVESIFNWPGLGYILLNALMHRDYLVVQAIVVWMAFVFLLVNLLADLISQIMNPKMKES